MRAIEVFKARHAFAQEIFYEDLWADYDEATLRTPVHPTMNTLVWVMWHVARVEDAGVTRFVTGEDQLLYKESWNDQLGVSFTDFGFGSTRADMLAISKSVNLDALRDYGARVREYVLASVDALAPERLDEFLSEEEVRQVLITEGVGVERIHESTVPIYTGWTRLEALYHFSTTHYYWHGGEVRTIEGILRGA